jgi:hypothetical protein
LIINGAASPRPQLRNREETNPVPVEETYYYTPAIKHEKGDKSQTWPDRYSIAKPKLASSNIMAWHVIMYEQARKGGEKKEDNIMVVAKMADIRRVLFKE